MLVTVNEVHVPLGSTVGVGRGTDPDGKAIWFGGDHRPMLDLMDAANGPEEVKASIDTWQVITDMDLVCEVLGHDFQVEDIADGVVGGGAAHVHRIYCDRCNTEGIEEDLS
jgi:hypothetical protein